MNKLGIGLGTNKANLRPDAQKPAREIVLLRGLYFFRPVWHPGHATVSLILTACAAGTCFCFPRFHRVIDPSKSSTSR